MKKILVIEDNTDILDNISEILEFSHYHVTVAQNGKIGIEKALRDKPDLILCDIMMPELDGYGVLHILHMNPELQDTPFIFLTAKTDPSDLRKGMSLGADDYLTKPFDATDLLNAVEGRIKKAELTRQSILNGVQAGSPLISTTNSEQALRSFVDGRHVDRYKKKQLIFSEGNHPIRLFYLKKGKVKIYKSNHEGKELILHIIDEQDFFGYTEMLEGNVYRTNAEALEESEIACIPRSEFEELMNANPQVVRNFLRLLARNIQEREEQLIHIAYNSLRRKVADALLSIFEKFKSSPDKYNVNLTRENLAAVAGTATESLIRTLSDFKAEGLIDIKEGRIAILQKEKLNRMVN